MYWLVPTRYIVWSVSLVGWQRVPDACPLWAAQCRERGNRRKTTHTCQVRDSILHSVGHTGQFSVSIVIWFDIQVSSVSLLSYGLTYRSVQCLYRHMVWHTGQSSVSVIIWFDIQVSSVSLSSYGLTYRSVQCLCHHMVWHTGQFSVSVIIWFDIQVSSVSLSSYGLTYRSVQCLCHHMVWHTGQFSVSVIIWFGHTGQFSVSVIIWFDIQVSSVSLSSYGLTYRSVQCLCHHMGQFSICGIV